MSSNAALCTLALALLAGCPMDTTGGSCAIDSDCSSSEVCARDEMCTASSSVRAVSASWTISGADANIMSCAPHPDLYIEFIGSDSGDTLGFSPVPCMNGLFSVDKLPIRFKQVRLGVDGGTSARATLNAEGMATLDLRL